MCIYTYLYIYIYLYTYNILHMDVPGPRMFPSPHFTQTLGTLEELVFSVSSLLTQSLPKRNNWFQWIGLRENWQENLQLIDADFFFQSGALFLAICYILEQKLVLCWILELTFAICTVHRLLKHNVLGPSNGIGCYHSVGWFRVYLGLV